MPRGRSRSKAVRGRWKSQPSYSMTTPDPGRQGRPAPCGRRHGPMLRHRRRGDRATRSFPIRTSGALPAGVVARRRSSRTVRMTVQRRRPLAVERIGDPAQLPTGTPASAAASRRPCRSTTARARPAVRSQSVRATDVVGMPCLVAVCPLPHTWLSCTITPSRRTRRVPTTVISSESESSSGSSHNAAAALNEATEPGLARHAARRCWCQFSGVPAGPVDAASDRLQPPRREHSLQLADRDHSERLAVADEPELASGDGCKVRSHRRESAQLRVTSIRTTRRKSGARRQFGRGSAPRVTDAPARCRSPERLGAN